MNENELLILDETTGLVHQYNGVGPGGIVGEQSNHEIGLLPCGCDGRLGELFVNSALDNNLIVISDDHLEFGVWKRAPCLEIDDE